MPTYSILVIYSSHSPPPPIPVPPSALDQVGVCVNENRDLLTDECILSLAGVITEPPQSVKDLLFDRKLNTNVLGLKSRFCFTKKLE